MIPADRTLSLERQNQMNDRHITNKKINNAQKASQYSIKLKDLPQSEMNKTLPGIPIPSLS